MSPHCQNMFRVNPRATLGRILFTISIKKLEIQLKHMIFFLRNLPTGQSEYSWDPPRENLSRQPCRFFTAKWHSIGLTLQQYKVVCLSFHIIIIKGYYFVIRLIMFLFFIVITIPFIWSQKQNKPYMWKFH